MSRLNSGEMFGAIVLIVLGVLFLAGNLGWFALNWGMLWPLMLILFGAWLIWRAFAGSTYTGGSAYFGFGDYNPDLTGKTLQRETLSHGFGDFDLDLTHAQLADGESVVHASLGFGDLTVIVPRDLAVRVRASAGFGDARVFERKADGIGPAVEWKSEDYAAATRKLDLEASVGFGEAKVIRAG